MDKQNADTVKVADPVLPGPAGLSSHVPGTQSSAVKGQCFLIPTLAPGQGEAPRQSSHAALSQLCSLLSQPLSAYCIAGSDSFRSSYALGMGPKPPIRHALHQVYTPSCKVGLHPSCPLPPCRSWSFLQLHRPLETAH